jgi:hypothetical protein
MGRHPNQQFQDTLLRLGLIPPDTAFNRRAQEYAERAVRDSNVDRYRKKQRKIKSDAGTPQRTRPRA